MEIEYFLFSVALPGAERREGAQPRRVSLHMTRRAFTALRVIRVGGHLTSRRAQVFCFWLEKLSLHKMTRRTLLALRVIQLHWESCSNMVIKKV